MYLKRVGTHHRQMAAAYTPEASTSQDAANIARHGLLTIDGSGWFGRRDNP